MKILLITQYFYPDNFHANSIATELVRLGHQVKVLTGLPDYTTSKIPHEYKWFKKRKEFYCGVDIHRVSIFARRTGILFRLLNYTSFVWSASLYALFSDKNLDAILVCAPSPVFQGIPAAIYKWRTGKKSIHYCYDPWPEALKAWNIKESSIIFKIVKKISAWIYQSCDIIAITSQPFRQYLIDVCSVDDNKIVYLPQHTEDLYCDIAGIYENNNCLDFLFAGNIGAVQDIDVIIRAVALVTTSVPFYVHIVGDGSEISNLKALAKSLQLDGRVIFHGYHPLEAMSNFYKLADCFLLTLRGGDFIGMTLPAKAQGYLCAGKPILAAIDGAGRELITQADCGEAVPAGDVKGLAEKMLLIIQNMERYKEKGFNGRRFYEAHFTKEIFMRRLLELLS